MVLVWTHLALFAAVFWLQPRVLPGSRSLSALTAVVLALLLATGSVQLLGWLGVLGVPGLLILTTAAAVGAGAAHRRWPPPPPASPEPAPLGPLAAAGAVVLAMPLGIWLHRIGWVSTRYSWDDLAYHGPMPAWWVSSGSLAYAPFTYQAYYPFNAELLTAWFMVPSHSMAHAGLALLAFALLLVAATLAICDALDIGLGAPSLLLAAFFISPGALAFTATVSATDLAMAAWLLAALAFAVAARQDHLRALSALSGLCAGAALGTKVSAAPIVALLGAWWLWRSRLSRGDLALWFVAGVLPQGAWWYARNLLYTGNPVFPAELGPFPGPFEAETQRLTTVADFVRRKPELGPILQRIYAKQLDWPHALTGMAAIGYVAGLVRALRAPERRAGLLLVLGAGAAVALLYPFQPFSGSVNRPDAMLHSTVRFLTLPLLAGLIGFGGRYDRRDRVATAVLGGCMAVYVSTHSWPKLKDGEAAAAILAAVLTAAALAGLHRTARRSVRQAVAVAIPVVGIVIMAGRTEVKLSTGAENMQRYRPRAGKQATSHVWAALETLPDGARIAYISEWPVSHNFYLPQFGQRLQHQPVAVARNGAPLAPLHRRWRSEPEDWWWEWTAREAAHDEAHTLSNLLESDATYLMLTRCQNARGSPWPAPREALRANGDQHRVWGDACSELWDLADIQVPEMTGWEPEGRPPAPKKKAKRKGKTKRKGKAP